MLGILAFSSDGRAQDAGIDIAPPPLKLLSRDEREKLNAVADLKKRSQLALDLMDARLKTSETLWNESRYEEMYAQLGGFHAIMDDTVRFLVRQPDNAKTLYSLKRFEIGLRGFIPRLQAIRSQLPYSFDPYVKSLIQYISEARDKATAPFFRPS
jgi:hypothetical protein